jgi:hypothetical protein
MHRRKISRGGRIRLRIPERQPCIPWRQSTPEIFNLQQRLPLRDIVSRRVKCLINATHPATPVPLRRAMHARNTHPKPLSNETRRNSATHGTLSESFLTRAKPQDRWHNQVSSSHCTTEN